MGKDELDRWLQMLADAKGSDLHVKAGSPPRMRVNGDLVKLVDESVVTSEDTAAMAAVVMRPPVAEAFEQNHEVDCAYAIAGLGRFRINVFRQRGSVAMVIRRVLTVAPTFEELGLPEVVARLASEQRGMVLVTGPTGSGKTTTLAAMIDFINRHRECHVVTIEDPIEVLHRDLMASINQREVGFDTRNFGSAMRAAMRQDPDVILVGEMRDEETVAAALTAAETGHLVLSTLHTIDAKETISRIVDFFPAHQQGQVRVALAGSLKGTICQRLVPSADGTSRVAALEVMIVNGRIQGCVVDPTHSADLSELIADGEYYGMQTFDQALAQLYEQGKIDLRGALVAATNPHDLKVLLQQRGLVSTGIR
ncbi:MAG: type IV pilus twitching motility protein PilT [Acidimicrobiales bacterium]